MADKSMLRKPADLEAATKQMRLLDEINDEPLIMAARWLAMDYTLHFEKCQKREMQFMQIALRAERDETDKNIAGL